MASDIVLYGNRPVTSPYVMAVLVALEEKGLPFEFLKLDLEKGEHLESGYMPTVFGRDRAFASGCL